MLKELSMNIPLVEALKKISGYTNFMNNLVTKKSNVNFEPIDNVQY